MTGSASVLVLVDADNVSARRIQPLLDLLDAHARITAAGSPAALRRVQWPADATLLPVVGWQRADLALAAAYRPANEPLILISGDGDFGLLAARHPAPVLIVSAAPSNQLRDVGTVVDPALDGLDPVRSWLGALERD